MGRHCNYSIRKKKATPSPKYAVLKISITQLLNVVFASCLFPPFLNTQLDAGVGNIGVLCQLLWRHSDPKEEVDFAKSVFSKMVNQRQGKNRKKLLIEEKSMAIGWRQYKISNSEIGLSLGCGKDAINWLFAYTV